MEQKNICERLVQSSIIDGIYGDKEIKINTFSVEGNKNVLINIHGTFGSLKGGKNKYLNFASKLQQEGISNVVLYESSRKNIPINTDIIDRYKQKQEKFIGKTFLDELEDARRVVEHSIKNSKKLYGICSNEIEITLNGNSLGGILAFYLASEFNEIKHISTVGTGLRLEKKDIPILDTFPNIIELKKQLETFKGTYLMHYGNKDDVFVAQAFIDLFQKVKTSNKISTHLLGVDHTFGKVGGNFSEKPYQEIFNNISRLLLGETLSTIELDLHVKNEITNIKDSVIGKLPY